MNATAEEPEAQSYVADRGGLRSSRANTRTPVPPWPHASTMIQWRQPSARAWLRLDWFASADADCNQCLQNMTSGKCKKPRTHRIARTIIHRHGHQNAGRHHDGADLTADGTRCSGQGSA